MNIHDGHRDRLRKQFLEAGLDGFSDVNALELLLFYAIPRADVNPLAHELLRRFKSLNGVMSASVEELMEVDGIGESSAVMLKLIPEFVRKAATSDLRNSRQVTSPSIAAEYLIPRFMFEENELALLLCLDANKRIIRCDEISRGVVNTVELNTRLIAETALRAKASSVILSHNHPDGAVSPSTDDINTTKVLKKSLDLLGVQLVDHIIVSGEEYSSLCELGYV